MSAALHDRARRVRQRVALRAWEYRQRHHAHGTWFRFRRALADAERVFLVSEEQARELLAEGFAADPVGAELQPPKIMIFVPADRIATLDPVRQVDVRLSAELLAARCLLLVRFP